MKPGRATPNLGSFMFIFVGARPRVFLNPEVGPAARHQTTPRLCTTSPIQTQGDAHVHSMPSRPRAMPWARVHFALSGRRNCGRCNCDNRKYRTNDVAYMLSVSCRVSPSGPKLYRARYYALTLLETNLSVPALGSDMRIRGCICCFLLNQLL